VWLVGWLQMSTGASSRVKRECASAYASTGSGPMIAGARKELTANPTSKVAVAVFSSRKQ
jgi:hypothetical protein